MKKKVVIIGSGLGGLAAGCRLAARGHLVDIFEKRDLPGGSASGMELRGFHFDTGPTILTMPFILDELFSMMGKQRQDYIQLFSVDSPFQVINTEKQKFLFEKGEDELIEQINRWQPAGGDTLKEYLQTIKSIYQFWFPFSQISLSKIFDALAVAPDLLRMKVSQSVFSQISHFFNDPFLQHAFSFYPIFLGGNPLSTPAIYSLIHHTIHEWGISYPSGGMGTLVTALAKLFEGMQGKLHLNAEVIEILTQKRRVTGIRLADGRTIHCDLVVSNCNPHQTYYKLLSSSGRRYTSRYPGQRYKFSSSAFIMYFGTRRRYLDSGLTHHNIILGPHYEKFYNDLFSRNILPGESLLYLTMPTFNDSSIAPVGHELFYVMSPVPNLQADIDWASTGKHYRDQIIRYLEDNFLPDLRSNIVVEHYNTPVYFHQELNCPFGTPFSYQPSLNQIGWFRPNHKSRAFDNLYFVGSGTHPGSGIPSVLTSAKIVDELISNSI